MFNALKALKALFLDEPMDEPLAPITPTSPARPKAITTLEAVEEKISAFKAEIKHRAEEQRQLNQLLAEETAKQERLRQAGQDLRKVYEDLTRAKTASEQKTAEVREAAALTRKADADLFRLLQELESPSTSPTSPTRSAPPAPPAPPRRPEPVAPAVAPPVTPKVASTIGSPEAAPYLELSRYND
jgi:hypothetical protein